MEAFVGIFCICMPALRKFLASAFPRCFASTQNNSKYEHYDTPNTPNKLSTGRAKNSKNSKASLSFGLTTFGGTGITKTTETRVESRAGSDDEIHLVDADRERHQKNNWAVSEADAGSEGSNSAAQGTRTFMR
jgi:hypothetical protein